jgi:hypothetical protein
MTSYGALKHLVLKQVWSQLCDRRSKYNYRKHRGVWGRCGRPLCLAIILHRVVKLSAEQYSPLSFRKLSCAQVKILYISCILQCISRADEGCIFITRAFLPVFTDPWKLVSRILDPSLCTRMSLLIHGCPSQIRRTSVKGSVFGSDKNECVHNVFRNQMGNKYLETCF